MKRSVIAILLLVFILTLAACGSTSTSGSSPSSAAATAEAPSADSSSSAATATTDNTPKVLRVGTLDAAATFDPTTNADCGLGLPLVYDTILHRNYETGEIEPQIATAWKYIDDTTLQLTIRENVKFSNGDTLTPEDILFSLQRFLNPNNRFDTGFQNIDYGNCKVDGNVLTLKLTQASPNLLIQLTNDRWASVLDKAYVEKAGEDSFWDAPVGTGPYTCVENVAGSHATYKLRDDYWGEKPSASEIIVNNYSEMTTMMVDFQNGDLDIVLNVGDTNYTEAQAGSIGDVQIKLFPSYDLLAVTLPEYTKMFDDINVRKAIAYALDTVSITKAVYGSLGEVADSTLIKGVTYYQAQGIYEYNPEKAKELLQAAGYKDGDITLKLVIPSTPVNHKTAEIVQAELAEIGITLTVEEHDFATAIPILMKNGTDISVFGTGGGTFLAADIYAMLQETSTNGGARVTDPTLNGYLTDGRYSMDDAARKQAYETAQKWMFDNYRWLPISYSNDCVLYQKNISDVVGATAKGVNLKYVVIS